jgi:hypothetical protein
MAQLQVMQRAVCPTCLCQPDTSSPDLGTLWFLLALHGTYWVSASITPLQLPFKCFEIFLLIGHPTIIILIPSEVV